VVRTLRDGEPFVAANARRIRRIEWAVILGDLARAAFLLLERRLTLTDLADRIGITIANLSILKTNKARAIRFSTLDALCRELKCQPADLLEWRPDDPERA
jgi:putative transcriptional regulator